MTDADTNRMLIELSEQVCKRLTNIEDTLQTIAVQDNKIMHLQEQMHEMYRKMEVINSPDGILAKLQNFQANCPRFQLPRIWWAIGLLGTFQVSLLVAIFTMILKDWY